MERSSSACNAASTGERLACASGGGAASANCAAKETKFSAQTRGTIRLRIHVVKGCLTNNYTRPRNIQCTPSYSGAPSAGQGVSAVQPTLVRRLLLPNSCMCSSLFRPMQNKNPDCSSQSGLNSCDCLALFDLLKLSAGRSLAAFSRRQAPQA